jgi:hypothetical protein
MEQPKPTPNDSAHITDLVVQDLHDRKKIGIQRYGTPLQANNGRNALLDAYEEALDLCQYLRQKLEEQRLSGHLQLETEVSMLVKEVALARSEAENYEKRYNMLSNEYYEMKRKFDAVKELVDDEDYRY